MNDAAQTVDILVFDLRGQSCGTDASEVLRIERPEGHVRALVYRREKGGEGQFLVDRVHGVRSIPVDSLRRPPASLKVPGALGFWLDGEQPVVLLDLQTAKDAS